MSGVFVCILCWQWSARKLKWATKVVEILLGNDAFRYLNNCCILFMHLALILWYPLPPNSILWRRWGLCSRRIRKINIVLGGRGENVTKTLQNRILLPSVSTLLLPIVVRSHRRLKLFLLHKGQLRYFAISIYLMYIPSALVAFSISILKKRFFSRLTACWKWYKRFFVDLKLVCFCCFMKIPLFNS